MANVCLTCSTAQDPQIDLRASRREEKRRGGEGRGEKRKDKKEKDKAIHK
jgi:hypothetical protein